jgi:GNAT superfamily N-acetyltransferase
MSTVRFRQYEESDADAVAALDAWTLQETATDPEDVPGREDLTEIESVYIESGGEFVVGVRRVAAESAGAGDTGVEAPAGTCEIPDERAGQLETVDGLVVAMGGFLPSETGHGDERTVPGAAELHRMRVAPPCQHSGYGRELLANLERCAAEAGFETMLATTARRQRTAVTFYPGAGYEQAGTSAVGEYDLVHFEKELQ